EPGHSKTMMAAFIVAVRGTVVQAVMLGLAATLSHTLVVWAIAIGGMYLWRGVGAETFEPYFHVVSPAIILSIALWMFWRTWRERRSENHADHDHHEEIRQIDTGHGTVALEIFEDGVPPRWRVRTLSGDPWKSDDVVLITERPDGSRQAFTFLQKDG